VRRFLVASGLALFAGCGNAAGDAGALLVGAASDLAAAMPELVAAFERESDATVQVTLGSSGLLARQIINGAPIDLFLSADGTWVDHVAEAGLVAPDDRVHYARGYLAIVTAAHRRAVERIEALAGADIGRVAIANPAHAPYGRAAREALERAGVWAALEPNVVYAENVRQTMQFVASGNVDAVITALSLVDGSGLAWSIVPDTLHAPLLQEAAAIGDRPNHELAVRFLRFLEGDDARATLARYRFGPPDVGAR
jgi:molybdate transport system substrate-binding protein